MNEKNGIERALSSALQHDAPACRESDALIAYLYHEVSASEAKDFERHLSACAVCRDEIAHFGGVRRAVGQWRDATLRPAASLIFQTPRDVRRSENAPGVRAAFRALREFLDLSPLWLKTGGALAMMLVCALAVFALANMELRWNDQGFALNTNVITRERVETHNLPAPPSQNSISPDEINEMVNARVAERLRSIADERETALINTGANQTSPGRNEGSQSTGAVVTPRDPSRRRRTVAPLTSPEDRSQIARREASRDAEPPRLYDLLGDLQ